MSSAAYKNFECREIYPVRRHDFSAAARRGGNTKLFGRRSYMWGILIALLSGALMSIQGVFNTQVTEQTGIWVSAGWVQLTAFLTCLLMWLFTGRQQVGGLAQVQPWYMLTGGVIGAFITCTVIKSVESLGPARSALLIVTAQIVVAYMIEVFGMFGMERSGFEWKKVIGALVAVAGIMIFQY